MHSLCVVKLSYAMIIRHEIVEHHKRTTSPSRSNCIRISLQQQPAFHTYYGQGLRNATREPVFPRDWKIGDSVSTGPNAV